MKSTFLKIAAVLLVAVVVYYAFSETAQTPSQVASQAPAPDANATVSTQPDRTEARRPSSNAKEPTYYEKVKAENVNVQSLHSETLKIINKANDPSAELVAEYVAEGIIRNKSANFASYMINLLERLNQNSDLIYDLIVEKESEFQKHPLIYQMVLNMANSVNFSEDQKVRIFGGGISREFTFNESGEMSEYSYSITNAMILMKNSNLDQTKVKQYIESGINLNKGNDKALKEFKARATMYFPSLYL